VEIRSAISELRVGISRKQAHLPAYPPRWSRIDRCSNTQHAALRFDMVALRMNILLAGQDFYRDRALLK
jgi:hypothetical protein